jgi:small subunit ribosomal protein S16
MLKMRLQRIGRKNSPSYRVLIVDSRQGPKSGKFIDHIGSYDPKADRVEIDGEKAREWIAKGVQVSGTVHNLLISQKIIEGKKINVLPRKTPIKKEADSVPAVENSVTETAEEVAPEVVEVQETQSEDQAESETPAEPEAETPAESVSSEATEEIATPEAAAQETPAEPVANE